MWHASGTAGEASGSDLPAAASARVQGEAESWVTTCLVGKSSESSNRSHLLVLLALDAGIDLGAWRVSMIRTTSWTERSSIT